MCKHRQILITVIAIIDYIDTKKWSMVYPMGPSHDAGPGLAAMTSPPVSHGTYGTSPDRRTWEFEWEITGINGGFHKAGYPRMDDLWEHMGKSY